MKTIISTIEGHLGESRAVWRFPVEKLETNVRGLYQRSEAYAAKLYRLGIGRQDRVGLILNNCSDYVALLIAIWRLNAIAVPLRPKGSKYTKSDKHLLYCDKVCDFNLIIYGDSATSEAFASWMNVPGKLSLSLEDFNALKAAAEPPSNASVSQEDIAILQFSSGSTGNPKAVLVTHRMMMAQLDNIDHNHSLCRDGFGVRSSASWAPINHDLGLFSGVLTPLYTDCDNLLAPPVYYMRNPARWFGLLSEYRVDFTFSTNSALATTLNAIARLHRRDAIDLSQLHIYIGAEKVSPIIVRRSYTVFTPLGLPQEQIHIGYGMAENALGCACTRTPKITTNSFLLSMDRCLLPISAQVPEAFELVALGTPDRAHEITVRDEHDKIVPELVLGEINIHSPCVSPGYYNNPALTHEHFTKGRFRTGDLGFYYCGELYFYSRKDDMITIGGRNVVPDDVEQRIEELPFIRPTSTCLVAVENTGTIELTLLIEMNSSLDAQTLRGYTIEAQKSAFSILEILIHHIVFCVKGSIEKTSSGKKRRKVIRDRLINNLIETIEVPNERETTI